MVWRTWIVVLAVFIATGTSLWAEEFSFKYHKGDSYRILSEVDQDIRINGVFAQNVFILNRIALSISESNEKGGKNNASYVISTERRLPSQLYQIKESYDVTFWRDKLGIMDVPKGSFVPTVRNVPVFPAKDLKPGDTWTAMGSEAHDLRKDLGVKDPFEFPIKVFYTYLGPVTKDGIVLHEFEAQYNIFQRYPRTGNRGTSPVQVTGNSVQHIFFDNNLGRPVSYEEEYFIVLTLSNNDSLEYSGTARARIVEAQKRDTADLKEEVEAAIEQNQLKDVTVRNDPEGLTISIENIQFAPDSAVLLPSEMAKLEHIGELLKGLPGYDIAISGHTALAGTAEGRKRLSAERAQSVGQFLLDRGVRKQDELMFQGFGAEKPVADNSTEAGKARNRRVEITILKN